MATGATTNPATIAACDQPRVGPLLMANSSDVAPTARMPAPAQSKLVLRRRSVSGSTRNARTSPVNVSGTWAMKIHRQPNVSKIGTPAKTPITGPQAPTIDQYPIACTRRSRGNIRLMIAIDAGPTAAPVAAPSVRNAISEPALHATAVRPANRHTQAIDSA